MKSRVLTKELQEYDRLSKRGKLPISFDDMQQLKQAHDGHIMDTIIRSMQFGMVIGYRTGKKDAKKAAANKSLQTD